MAATNGKSVTGTPLCRIKSGSQARRVWSVKPTVALRSQTVTTKSPPDPSLNADVRMGGCVRAAGRRLP
jgi:hypothetical protein